MRWQQGNRRTHALFSSERFKQSVAAIACRGHALRDSRNISLVVRSEIACRREDRLTSSLSVLLEDSPYFARACGRVSVGGHPDKRPDSRLRKRPLLPCTRDRQPEANRRTPLSTGDAA